MIVTTTPSVEGRRITAYHGVVTGETIIGANIFRDLFAGIRDIVGGRSGAYEKVLADVLITWPVDEFFSPGLAAVPTEPAKLAGT